MAITDAADKTMLFHDANEMEIIPEDHRKLLLVVENFKNEHTASMTQWVTEATNLRTRMEITHGQATSLAGEATAEYKSAKETMLAENSAQGKLQTFETHAEESYENMRSRYNNQAQAATGMVTLMQNSEAARKAEELYTQDSWNT